MDTVTYPHDEVAAFIDQHLVAVKVPLKEYPELAENYLAKWTPTVLIADEQGEEHYRIEGYLPPETFTARLSLGVGKLRFHRGEHDQAAERFDEVARRHAGSDCGAEAAYWRAVVAYKQSGDAKELLSGWKKVLEEYPDSEWSQRADVPKAKK